MVRYILILLILLAGFTANATTYYVATAANGGEDGAGHTGLIADPWLTVDYAATRVTTAGDIIYVTDGSYTEPNRIELSVGVSILGTGDGSHIISTYHPVGADAFDGSIYIRSATQENGNQSVSYIKLTGSSLTAWYGIYTANRNNVKIHHCTIEDFRDRGVKFWGHAHSDGVYTTGNEIYNCTIDNSAARVSGGAGLLHFEGQQTMLIHDNIFRNLDHAADVEYGNAISTGDGYNKDIKIYNNKFYMLPDAGVGWCMAIEHWDSRGGIEIYDNEFYGGGTLDMGGYTNSKGAYTYSFWVHDNYFDRGSTLPFNASREYPAMSIEGTCRDIIVERNHVKYFQFGIKQSLATDAITHERIYIRYNIFENCGVTNNNWGAAHMQRHGSTNTIVDSVFFYNNVFTQSASAASGAFGALWQPSNAAGQSTTNLIYKNNIIKGFTEAPFGLYPDGVGGTITSMTNAFNILYQNGNSNDIWYDGTASITNLTESDTLKRDPDFISTTNFRLQASSPAINAGTDVSLTSDYDGNPIVGIVDIGAFEYQTLPVSTTGLGWEPVLSKRDFKDDVNLPQSRWMINRIPVTATASELNALVGQGQIISGLDTASLSNRIDKKVNIADTLLSANPGYYNQRQVDSIAANVSIDTTYIYNAIEEKADTVDQSFTGTTVISKLNVGSATSATKAEVDSCVVYNNHIYCFIGGDTVGVGTLEADRVDIEDITIMLDDTLRSSGKHILYTQWQVDSLLAGFSGGTDFSRLAFIVDSTGGMPVAGDSIVTVAAFIDKHIEVSRGPDGDSLWVQARKDVGQTYHGGYSFQKATGKIVFTPHFETGEHVLVVATDSTSWTDITATSFFCADYLAAYNAMPVKPGIDTAWQQNLMFKRIVDTANVDLFYLFANRTKADAYINWIDPGTFDITDVTAPTFTKYQGITGNGSSQVVSTNFNAYADSASAYFSKNDAGIGVYMRTNVGGNYAPIGSRISSTMIRMIPNNGSNVMGSYMNATGSNSTPNTTTLGFAAVTRTSKTVTTNYMNGVALEENDAVTSGSLNDCDIYILAYNYNATPTYYFPGEISAVILGEGFSAQQIAEINTAIEVYMDYIGKGVE